MSISQHGNIITTVGVTDTPYVTDGAETLTLSAAAAAGDRIIAISGATSSARALTVTDDRSGTSHTYNNTLSNEQVGQCEIWIREVICDSAVNNVIFTLDAALASPAWAAAFVMRATNGWVSGVGDSATNLKTAGASPAQTAATGFTTTAASALAVAIFMPIVNETWNDPVGVDSDTANCTNIIRFSSSGAGGAAAYQILTATKTDYSISFGYTTGNAEGPLLIVEFQENAGGAAGPVRVRARMTTTGVG